MPFKPIARESQQGLCSARSYAEKAQSQFVTAVTNSEFPIILVLCLTGLLLFLSVAFYFPDFGAVIAGYNQF